MVIVVFSFFWRFILELGEASQINMEVCFVLCYARKKLDLGGNSRCKTMEL